MPRVLAYHRPSTVQDALALLAGGDAHVLAGGSDLVGRLNTGDLNDVSLVDLQALGLDTVEAGAAGRVVLGAMATLAQLADADALPSGLRELARAEQPSTLRTRATVGGIVAGRDGESALLAGLLAADAAVTSTSAAGPRTEPLAAVLAAGVAAGSIITSIDVATDGAWATSATKRTPADSPIVSAVGRRRADGSVVLALTGVAETPVAVDAAGIDGLTPPADFRGSAEYRRHLAGVHSARVFAALASAN